MNLCKEIIGKNMEITPGMVGLGIGMYLGAICFYIYVAKQRK